MQLFLPARVRVAGSERQEKKGGGTSRSITGCGRTLSNVMHFLETHGVPRENIRAFFDDYTARVLGHELVSFDGKTYGKDLRGLPYVADVPVQDDSREYRWNVRKCLRKVPATREDVLVVYLRSHGTSDGMGMTAPNGHHWSCCKYVSLASEVRAGTVLFFAEGCSSCQCLAGCRGMAPFVGRNVLFICSTKGSSTAGTVKDVEILQKSVPTKVGGLLLESLLKRLTERRENMTRIAELVRNDILEDGGIVAIGGTIPNKSLIFRPRRR